jgi:hypothetical protein
MKYMIWALLILLLNAVHVVPASAITVGYFRVFVLPGVDYFNPAGEGTLWSAWTYTGCSQVASNGVGGGYGVYGNQQGGIDEYEEEYPGSFDITLVYTATVGHVFTVDYKLSAGDSIIFSFSGVSHFVSITADDTWRTATYTAVEGDDIPGYLTIAVVGAGGGASSYATGSIDNILRNGDPI